MVIHHLRKRDDEFQFSFSRMHINKKELSKVLAIGIPAGIQGGAIMIVYLWHMRKLERKMNEVK